MVSGSDGCGFKGETGLQMLRIGVEPVACPIGRDTTGLQHGGLDGAYEGFGVDDVLMPATEDDVLTHGGYSLKTRVVAGDGPVSANVAVVVGEVAR